MLFLGPAYTTNKYLTWPKSTQEIYQFFVLNFKFTPRLTGDFACIMF